MKRESLGLRIHDEHLEVLDQTQLPRDEVWLPIREVADMIKAIQRLSVRGAPLIGVAAVMCLAREALREKPATEILQSLTELRASRPTAVNLMNLLDQLKRVYISSGHSKARLIEEAFRLFDEDVQLCERMADNGQKLIQDGDNILTHCNTGGLATVGLGTALGVIKRAHQNGRKLHVFVDETRPLLQGARLTTWELQKAGIPFTLICDNMAGSLLSQGRVQKIFVGADRITANGDAANKIGTYSLAVLAKHHGCPFYVVAPKTTFDLSLKDGRDIPIEERKADELRPAGIGYKCDVWNPSFDVTPRALITEIITDA